MNSQIPLLLVLLAPALPLLAQDVIFETSFEAPAVSGRVPKSAGGDPSKTPPSRPAQEPAWQRFEDQPNLGAEGGSVVAGLTNRMARTGQQSLFVEASRLSAPYIGAQWVTRAIPVKPGHPYRVVLWGRNDVQQPLRGGSAQLFLKIQVDFYTDDGLTETGESQYLLLLLPGGNGREPFIAGNVWLPLGFAFEAPAGAKTMTVSFRCNSSAEKGAVSGLVYFDDFSVTAEPPRPAAIAE